ncbi:hypothetical protein LWF15_19835 [Kineosporia rhizophila]|uniref:hypothetical protein n=1 Tax=Kineosporia rhizophila TaxID=84633 RepID=UPI001E3EC35D|nr:hypothetical protein [Kineosporia rhizophila]MCE0537747.1 hypothetical protein [Kineosporia rhizophila]
MDAEEGQEVKRWAIVLLVCGIAGAVINEWAFRQFPETWGGPNIGGGALQVCFYAMILGGVVLLARVALSKRG